MNTRLQELINQVRSRLSYLFSPETAVVAFILIGLIYILWPRAYVQRAADQTEAELLQTGENIVIVLRVTVLLCAAGVFYALIHLRRYNVEWYQSGLDRLTFWHLSSFQRFWHRITNRIGKAGYLDDHSVSLLLDDLEPLTTLMPVVGEPVLHLDRMLVTQCDSTEVVGDLRLPTTIPLVICHPLGDL